MAPSIKAAAIGRPSLMRRRIDSGKNNDPMGAERIRQRNAAHDKEQIDRGDPVERQAQRRADNGALPRVVNRYADRGTRSRVGMHRRNAAERPAWQRRPAVRPASLIAKLLARFLHAVPSMFRIAGNVGLRGTVPRTLAIISIGALQIGITPTLPPRDNRRTNPDRSQRPDLLRRQRGQQRSGRLPQHRVNPVRRDIGQRRQHERAQMRPRVRQDRIRRIANQTRRCR